MLYSGVYDILQYYPLLYLCNQRKLMEKNILTFSEACAYTGFAESYMYKLTSARKIPHSKPNGKKIFFDKELLDKWLLSNPVKTKEEINKEAVEYMATGRYKSEVVIPLDRLPEIFESMKNKK